MIFKKLILAALLPFLCVRIYAQNYSKLDSLTENLDKIIENNQKRIDILSARHKEYELNNRLFEEYMSFKYDSAYKYITENLKIAEKNGNLTEIYDCKLKYTQILSVAGLFPEADATLKQINPDSLNTQQKIIYYSKKTDLFLYSSEFNQKTEFYNTLRDSNIFYHKKILEIASKDSYDYNFSNSSIEYNGDDKQKAIEILENYIEKNKPEKRTFSILTSTLAFYYNYLGNQDKAEKYYILTAENDLENAIMENTSLRQLSEILLKKGESSRAFRYLLKSSQCANFYGSQLRNVQTTEILNKITTAYENEKSKNHQKTVIMLIIISCIAILLVFTAIKLIRKNKYYHIANLKISIINKELDNTISQLKNANSSLKETNLIKEEYIGRFMTLCSQIVEIYEDKHNSLNKLAREKKMSELYSELKSENSINNCTKLFYQNFDEAFLNIFPEFCNKVNQLLKPEFQIEIKDKMLTTELRVLALLRLGISDNKQIASILRSSMSTIYTYRSKIRAKALDKDNFEDIVKNM